MGPCADATEIVSRAAASFLLLLHTMLETVDASHWRLRSQLSGRIRGPRKYQPQGTFSSIQELEEATSLLLRSLPHPSRRHPNLHRPSRYRSPRQDLRLSTRQNRRRTRW